MFCKESFLGLSAWSCTIFKRPHKLTVCYWSNLAVMLNPLFCFLFILLMSVSNHSLDFFFLDWSCFCTIFLSFFFCYFISFGLKLIPYVTRPRRALCLICASYESYFRLYAPFVCKREVCHTFQIWNCINKKQSWFDHKDWQGKPRIKKKGRRTEEIRCISQNLCGSNGI